MSETIKVNIQDTTKHTDALLDFCCKHSETELDYEYAESLLESNDGKSEVSSVKSNTSAVVVGSKLPKLADVVKVKPVPSSSTAEQTTTKTGSKFRLQEQIIKNGSKSSTSDVLDLHRIAEKFAGAKSNILQSVKKAVYDAAGFKYEVAIGIDKLLEEARTICDKCENKLDGTTRGKLLKLISELEELKQPLDTEKATRVADWLNNHTNQPEPEMCRFTLQDPFQLRKFVSGVRPRKSTSDTNISLGKRKRGNEDCGIGDVSSVHGSSSDTRVFVHADWSRPRAPRKRRRVRE